MKTITTMPVIGFSGPLQPLRGLPPAARVDCDRKVIYGAAVIQRGDLNAGDVRPLFIDDTTLTQVLKFGNASAKGLKARWTHPNMSSDGMGNFLGRWRNFRLSSDGASVLADLHLSRIAFRGPDGGRGQYVLDMAADDPDAFGVSIYPATDDEAMDRDEDERGMKPMRIKRMVAGDIVDDPAATRGGLFGTGQLSLATAPSQLTAALDKLFAEATPEVIRARSIGFLDTYLASRFGGQDQRKGVEIMEFNQEKFDASLKVTLDTFGAALSTKLLGEVDAKLAALKPSDKTVEPTPAEIEKRGAERLSQLCALAATAGLKDHEKVGKGWFDQGLSVADATAAVKPMMVAAGGLTKDAGENGGDPDAKYKAEYQSQLASFVSMGLTEAEYITSRKIDDGKELLAAGAGVKQAAAA